MQALLSHTQNASSKIEEKLISPISSNPLLLIVEHIMIYATEFLNTMILVIANFSLLI